MNKKLKKTFKKFDKDKENKQLLISGELGITLNGSNVVDVPGRKGFVYVRLKGNTSELIQAYNATVPSVYDLPIFVVRQGGIYKVVGRNIERHTNQWGTAAYLPKHGAQHSFNHDINVGGDIAWIYSQQFMPLLSYPSGTAGAMTLSMQPHFYEWAGSWRYAQNTGTPSYSPYLPLTTNTARMVLSYIDPSNNSIKLVPGTPFSASLTGSAEIAQYIPDIPRSVGIPLAAVRLVTGTTTIGWDAIYDMRDFYTTYLSSGTSSSSSSSLGFTGWDEGIILGTGTVLNVVGAGATLTLSGTVFNLSVPGGGGAGGGSIGIVGWDEGVYVATGTVLNVVGPNATLSASGTVLNLSITNPAVSTGTIGIWDEGAYLGMATILNVVGENADISVSGTVARLFVTGTPAVSNNSIIGIAGWDEGIFVATGTILNVVGPNAVLSASGTVLNLSITNPAVATGTFSVWDEGAYLGTATTLNVVGPNADISISGSVARLFVTGSFAGGVPGIAGWDEGVYLGTGTVMNFVGSGVTASLSGTVFNVSIPGIYTAYVTSDMSSQINGTGTVFTLSSAPSSVSTLRLFYNGIRQRYTYHYTITGSSVYTLFTPITGSVLIADYDTSSVFNDPAGTGFPVSPTTGDKFYRTDRNIAYYYDGTRWLSQQIFYIDQSGEGTFPASANGFGYGMVDNTYGMYLLNLEGSTFVGATNDGSNYWTVAVDWRTSIDTIISSASFATSADSPSTWTRHTTAINAVMNSTARAFVFSWSKTGAPSNIHPVVKLSYRLIG